MRLSSKYNDQKRTAGTWRLPLMGIGVGPRIFLDNSFESRKHKFQNKIFVVKLQMFGDESEYR